MVVERLVPGTREWELCHHEHEQRYRFFAERYAGLKVLDAACGVGYGSAIIAEHGARSVTGIDIDASAIRYAKQHFDRPGVAYAVASVEDVAAQGPVYDLVVSFETIEHLKDPAHFIREVRQALRPAGRFICSTPNKNFYDKWSVPNPYHLSEMTFEEFSAAFQRDFEVDERFHQSPTESYRRHVELVNELRRYAKAVRFSKLLAFENWIRKRIGKESWDLGGLPPLLDRFVPGDYVIEPLGEPLPAHHTYILVGHAKS